MMPLSSTVAAGDRDDDYNKDENEDKDHDDDDDKDDRNYDHDKDDDKDNTWWMKPLSSTVAAGDTDDDDDKDNQPIFITRGRSTGIEPLPHLPPPMRPVCLFYYLSDTKILFDHDRILL